MSNLAFERLQHGWKLHQAGDLAEAEAVYRQVLALDPREARASYMLGRLAFQQGRHDEALRYLNEAVRGEPREPLYRAGLAESLQSLGRLKEAGEAYRAALALDPHYTEVHVNLGNTLLAQGQLEEAAACYRRAIQCKGALPEAHNCLGAALQKQGRLDEAVASFRQALALRPHHAQAHYNLGVALRQVGNRSEAAEHFRAATQCDPKLAGAHHKLVQTLFELGLVDERVEASRNALEASPESHVLYNTMALSMQEQGRGAEALAIFRKGLDVRPDHAAMHSNLLYALNYLPLADPDEVFAEHRAWAARHAEPLTARAEPHANDRSPDRRLRVGYVSAYFQEHAVNFFAEPMIVAHDHDAVEVFCYSDVRIPDETTARVRSAADHWRDTRAYGDQELAKLVREDKIDILVDLAGHIGGNRLLVFARKPAPVQVTYLGYQNTTGMTAMDYRLTDERADPPGATDRYYTEKLVRLPRAFFCYRPADDAPDVTPLPAAGAGLVTFGSFNSWRKVTPRVIDAWLSILSRVPESRLLALTYRSKLVERQLRSMAEERGISSDRIELFNVVPRREYLKFIQRSDIALDPFPFNGHTTTCDAIWQGVPVVMLEGNNYVSRFGGSVLANVGLEALIAKTVEQYIETAVRLASDLESLAALRAGLRAQMAASPIMDFAGFTRHLEAAYRQMWHAWCARQAPADERP